MLFSPSAHEADQAILSSDEERPKGYWQTVKLVSAEYAGKITSGNLEELERFPPIPAPSPDMVSRHSKRYGPEGVEEVLSIYRPKEEVTPSSLREQGYSVGEIATTLKISEKRVRAALAA